MELVKLLATTGLTAREIADVQSRCRHAPHLRSWIAGYGHDELNKALSLGYVVLDVYEVWHWEVSDVIIGDVIIGDVHQ